MLQRNVKPQRN